MACISRMDSSTFPCSPTEPNQFSNYSTNMTAFPLAETPEGERNGMRRTIDLDLFRSSLNCQLDFRDFAHLESYMISVSALCFASQLSKRKRIKKGRLKPRRKASDWEVPAPGDDASSSHSTQTIPDLHSLIHPCRARHQGNILTKFVVLAFSSGVFSNLRCAARMRLSHSSTNWKILDSYSF